MISSTAGAFISWGPALFFTSRVWTSYSHKSEAGNSQRQDELREIISDGFIPIVKAHGPAYAQTYGSKLARNGTLFILSDFTRPASHFLARYHVYKIDRNIHLGTKLIRLTSYVAFQLLFRTKLGWHALPSVSFSLFSCLFLTYGIANTLFERYAIDWAIKHSEDEECTRGARYFYTLNQVEEKLVPGRISKCWFAIRPYMSNCPQTNCNQIVRAKGIDKKLTNLFDPNDWVSDNGLIGYIAFFLSLANSYLGLGVK